MSDGDNIVLSTDGYVLVILSDMSVERLMRQDPAELQIPGLPLIAITHASPADQEKIIELAKAGDSRSAVRYATRGWQFRPDLNDRDDPPEVVLDERKQRER